jgi:hypothetical protein
MDLSFVRRGALLALAVGAAACTQQSTTPTAPSVITFSPILNPGPKVEGLFQGPMTITDIRQQITGGTGPLPNAGNIVCVQDAFRQAITNGDNVNNASLTLTQDPVDVRKITARLSSESTGLACTYNGRIGTDNGLILDALPRDCTGTSLVIRCFPPPDNPTATPGVYTMEFQGASLTATFEGWPVNVTSMSGRAAVTYNLFSGADTPSAGYVAQHDLFFVRR